MNRFSIFFIFFLISCNNKVNKIDKNSAFLGAKVVEQLDNSYSLGYRISKYANDFIGIPYDRIPIGLYVDSRRIIADEEVDCMYLVFRVVELALANGNQKKSLDIGKFQRFHNGALLDKDGFVMNYEDRFDYSEDMIASGKWGKSIFKKNEMSKMIGSRMYKYFYYIPNEGIIGNKKMQSKIKSGDILFLFKDPHKRSKSKEAIGHLGILDVVDNKVYFIHASGVKGLDKKQGKVKKILLDEYLLNSEKFVGVYISRIDKNYEEKVGKLIFT